MNKPLIVASIGVMLGAASCLSLWNPFLQSVPDNADLALDGKEGPTQPANLDSGQPSDLNPSCVRFVPETDFSPAGPALFGVWGADVNHVWAVGQDGIVLQRTSRGSWTSTVLSAGSINAVWGTSADDVWAVGENSSVLRYDGKNWTPVDGLTSGINLSGVWRNDANSNLWVTGENGYFAYWDETEWVEGASESGARYFTVWGKNASSFWLGGITLNSTAAIGAPMFYDEELTVKDLEVGMGMGSVRGFWGPSGDLLWAVGDQMTINRFSNQKDGWKPEPHPVSPNPSANLYSITGLTADDVWVVGEHGTILRYKNQRWNDCSPKGMDTTLWHVWAADAQNIWVVGANGVILHSQ